MTNKLKGQGIIVVGGQWGDEGKGRIVDSLAEECDVVVRFQGGNNAGHSLHVADLSLVLHLIPCGIIRNQKICIIGNGVVIDPEVLFQEIDLLQKHDVSCSPKNLKISQHAHIIFPFHKLIDSSRENRSESHIGTTKRGIGPCYEDKVARFGIIAQDLLSEDLLRTKLTNVLNNRYFFDQATASIESLSRERLLEVGLQFGKRLAPFLCDTGELLQDLLNKKRKVLFEGAQGTLLDVDHGTYPYVTSSNCVAAQASIGAGIGMGWFSEVFMVSKAYCTRVGAGPFFTEASHEEQERFRKIGNEFGATTGRPRRCGWLDLPALKYAARLNGATGLILTKLDVLGELGQIKVGMSYSCGSKKALTFSEALHFYNRGEKIDVEYLTFPGVSAMPAKAITLSDLPAPFLDLCRLIERETNIPIRLVSYGRERGQEIFLNGHEY